MRVLFDECVPWPLHRDLAGLECASVAQCGWAGIKNGDLLARAEGRFDVFLTADQNLRYQQNLSARTVAIVELSSNDLRRVRAAAPTISAAIASTTAGVYVRVEVP